MRIQRKTTGASFCLLRSLVHEVGLEPTEKCLSALLPQSPIFFVSNFVSIFEKIRQLRFVLLNV